MRWLILLVPLLIASNLPPQPNVERPADLKQYVKEFYTLFPDAKRIDTYLLPPSAMPTVTDPLTRLYRKAHGICYVGLAQINSEFWAKANEWHKRKVVFHELGHCAWQLGHPQDPFTFSIMNQVLWTVEENGKNWPALLKELKNRVEVHGVRPF